MIRHVATVRVRASAEETFDVIGREVFTHHPMWEPAVKELRRLDDGPVRVGSRGVMVRRDGPTTREVTYVVTEFDAPRRIAFSHPDQRSRFDLAFDVETVDADTRVITATVIMQLAGAARLLEPLVRLATPRRSDKLTRQMGAVVDEVTTSRRAQPRPVSEK